MTSLRGHKKEAGTYPAAPAIPLAEPNLAGNEARYLMDCVESNFVSSIGPYVDRFEQMVARESGSEGAVATASGTAGLHLSLVALGVQPGDLVVLPSMTFIASANAIAHCGAAPWLLDVNLESWTLDPALLRDTLRAETERKGNVLIHRSTQRRVAAIMPVHALGMPADMDPIVETAREYGLPVVADGAAALGATYRGRPIGQTGADLTVFSFNGNKTVTAGGGGAVAGEDMTLLSLAKHLSTTARRGPDYHHDRIGYNYRMTNLQAAVGCAQLEQLDTFVAAKRRVAACYDEALSDLSGVGSFPDPDWADSACWISGAVLETPPCPPVGQVCAALGERGINASPFWKPMHLQPPYADAPRTEMSACESFWERVMALPCSTNLKDEDRDRVIVALREAITTA